MLEPTLTDVPVRGGDLRVALWNEGTPVVALHGITATHAEFPFLAEALPGQQLIAPDLRGRGGSRDLPRPFGMATHADDAAEVIRATADGPVVVVGHSMGGFVAVVLAHRHPALVRSVVLVDGGLPFAPVEQETTLAGLTAIKQRLVTTFADRAAYRDFFRAHPAFARDWTPEVERYADYDLVSEPGTPSARPDAVEADQVDIVEGAAVAEALEAPAVPIRFLHTDRGFVDDPPGLYAAEDVEHLRAAYPRVAFRFVPDVNHYTIMLSQRGASAVAEEIGAAAAV